MTITKAYRSFRVPVNEEDEFSLIVELISRAEGCSELRKNFTEIKGVSLSNISISGLGFFCGRKIDTQSEIQLKLHFGRSSFIINSRVVRCSEVYNEYGECEKYFVGAEHLEESLDESKKVLGSFISSFSKKKLKKHLSDLILQEGHIVSHGTKQKVELLVSIFNDMRKFRGTKGFVKGFIQEARRALSAAGGNIYFFNFYDNTLSPYELETLELQKIKLNLNNSRLSSLVSKGELLNFKAVTGKMDDFYWQLLTQVKLKVDNSLCCPIYAEDGKISGVVEFINSTKDQGFDSDDESYIFLVSLVCSLLFKEFENQNERSEDYSSYKKGQVQFELVGESLFVKELSYFIDYVAGLSSSVLICGERGTGKGQVAHAIHQKSSQVGAGCVVLNCHSILGDESFKEILSGNEHQLGKLELCGGSTLLLQEVEALSVLQQEMLFESLQGRSDIRIIATTKENIDDEGSKSKFSSKFFKFISEESIELQPLSKRKEDIPHLINCFLKKKCEQMGMIPKIFDSELLKKFTNYSWPDNVQELKTAVERLIIYNPSLHILGNYDNDVIPIFDKHHFQQQYYQKLLAEGNEFIQEDKHEEIIEGFKFELIKRTIQYYDGEMEKVSSSLDISLDEINEVLRNSKVA